MFQNLLQGVDSMKEIQRSNEELIKLIQNGVDVNENYLELYQQNRGFIFLVIRKRIRGINDEEDLMQQAFLALVKAVNYHNCELEETNFLQILKYCIWNEIRDLTGELPAQMQNKIYKYRKTKDKLFNELGRQPKNYEIMLEMDIDLKQLEEIKKAYRFSNTLSLDKPLSEEGETTLLELYSDSQAEEDSELEDKLSNEELRKVLDEAINKLPDRSQKVISDRYYKNMTMEQCGQEMNVSRERVRQIESEGFRKLRKDRQLERRLEGYIDIYKHVGVNQFNNTRTSSVEWLAIRREQKGKELLREMGLNNILE